MPRTVAFRLFMRQNPNAGRRRGSLGSGPYVRCFSISNSPLGIHDTAAVGAAEFTRISLCNRWPDDLPFSQPLLQLLWHSRRRPSTGVCALISWHAPAMRQLSRSSLGRRRKARGLPPFPPFAGAAWGSFVSSFAPARWSDTRGASAHLAGSLSRPAAPAALCIVSRHTIAQPATAPSTSSRAVHKQPLVESSPFLLRTPRITPGFDFAISSKPSPWTRSQLRLAAPRSLSPAFLGLHSMKYAPRIIIDVGTSRSGKREECERVNFHLSRCRIWSDFQLKFS